MLGSAVAHTHYGISQMPDLTVTPAALSGAAAFREAGIEPGDVDVAELYDSFTYTALGSLRTLGSARRAKAASSSLASGPLPAARSR